MASWSNPSRRVRFSRKKRPNARSARRNLAKGSERSEPALERRDLNHGRFLNREAHFIGIFGGVEESRLSNSGNRTGRFFAQSQGFNDAPFTESVLNSIDELFRTDLTAVEKQCAFDDDHQRHDGDEQYDEHHRTTIGKETEIKSRHLDEDG